MQLKRRSDNLIIARNLLIASSFYARMKGLLGEKKLEEDKALWIKRCNSIHTFFMHFPIDAIFINEQHLVVATYSDIQPWRIIFPVWKAQSVIELASGIVKNNNIVMGDQLDVGT